MSVSKIFKKLSILAMFGLIVGCASTPQVDENAVTEAMAKEAMDAAAQVIDRGNALGADTLSAQALLTQAQSAFAAGDYARALELANQAKAEAEAALAARRAEIAAQQAAAAANANVSEASSSSSYQVVSGDSLWSIAGSSAGYGDPYQWPLIYKANKSQIKDADLIFPGQVFDIVSGSASEVEAAIQHAKTRGAWSIGSEESSDAAYLAR